MTDRTPEQIRDEAARILESPTFKGAMARIRDDAMVVLLAASGPEADTIRREQANLINSIDRLREAIEADLRNADDKLRPRAQVA